MSDEPLFAAEPFRVEYLAHWWRYFGEHLTSYADPDDARAVMVYGEADGQLSSCCIIYPDGTRRAIDYNDKIDPTVLPPHDGPLPDVEGRDDEGAAPSVASPHLVGPDQ